MTTEELRKSLNRKLAEREAARQRYKDEKRLLREAEGRVTNLQHALSIAQGIAQAVQEEAHRKVADIVSRSLEAVFDEPYQFRILFEQKRGRTEASLTFERDGMQVDPMTASGGGVVDVAAFALRLSCLLLSRPSVRRFLALDEPFRFVSAEYRPRVRELVQTLAKDLDCQFLIVTHIDELKAGKVVQL